MKIENELNERFLRKNDPELLNGILAATLETEKRKTKLRFADSVNEHQTAKANNSVQSLTRRVSGMISRTPSGSSFETHSRGPSVTSLGTFRTGRQQATLSFLIKLDICEAECKHELLDLRRFEMKMKSEFCQLLAEIEEIEFTTKDVSHAIETFQDFVVKKGKNN